jgi:hypothetical protein
MADLAEPALAAALQPMPVTEPLPVQLAVHVSQVGADDVIERSQELSVTVALKVPVAPPAAADAEVGANESEEHGPATARYATALGLLPAPPICPLPK